MTLLAAALCAIPMLGTLFAANVQQPEKPLLIEQASFPLVTWFRKAENVKSFPSYEAWRDYYSTLMGLTGKVLWEELLHSKNDPSDTTRPDWFRHFKQEFPDRSVFLHFNGNARRPDFAMGDFFPGHWLYFEGTTTMEQGSAPEADAVQWINVKNASLFSMSKPNAHVVICPVQNGRPDWANGEYAELLAVNQKNNRIRVRRGLFGTSPVALVRGSTYIAQHVSTEENDETIFWKYNYSAACPRDPDGKTCADRLIQQIEGWFGGGGWLENFDGIEFDVFPGRALKWEYMASAVERFNPIDTDGDGRGDNGVIDGVDQFALGAVDFLKRLRLTPNLRDKFVMADGMREWQQRAVGVVGIEAESFPSNTDPEFVTWSTAVNLLQSWKQGNEDPRSFMRQNGLKHFTYVANKHQLSREELKGNKPPNFAPIRLIMGAATALELGLAMHVVLPGDTPDEAFGAAPDQGALGWLGRPLELRRYGLQSPDLLRARGAEALLASAQSPDHDVRFEVVTRDGTQHLAAIPNDKDKPFRILLKDLPLGPTENPDVLVGLSAVSASRPPYPDEMPRRLVARLHNPLFLTASKPDRVLEQRDKGPINELNRETAAFGGSLRVLDELEGEAERRFSREFRVVLPTEAVEESAALMWERSVENVPPHAELVYDAIATKQEIEGAVTFKVHVKSAKEPDWIELKSTDVKGGSRISERVDLSPYANKKVDLRFEIFAPAAEIAKRAKSGTWADVRITAPGAGPDDIRPFDLEGRINAWGETPSTFYFRKDESFPGGNIPASASLEIQVEAGGPVYLRGLTVHAAPDTMARKFENGVVLVNPSNHPVAFTPEGDFQIPLRHIAGRKEQDPAVNDGSLVGQPGIQPSAKVTVPPKDAVFLSKEKSRTTTPSAMKKPSQKLR